MTLPTVDPHPIRSAIGAERDLKIAVVVPAYRVADHIERTLADLPDFIDQIIVVNDASPDDTAQRLGSCSDRRLIVVTHERNQGVGGAMISGYRRAIESGADIVVKMDGDNQMDPAQLPWLLEPLLAEEADYAKGNRFYDLERLERMPWVRRFGNVSLSFLTKLASGYWNISDPSNGYTAIRIEALRRLDLSRIGRDFFFETDMLIHLNMIGAVVEDVPIPARYADESSSLDPRRILAQFPPKLLRGAVHRFLWRHMLIDFAPQTLFVLFGLIGVMFGLIFGSWKWALSHFGGHVATAGTVMLSGLPFLIGVLLLLQALVLEIHSVPRAPICRRRKIPIRLKSQPGDQTAANS